MRPSQRIDVLWPCYREALRDLMRTPSLLGEEPQGERHAAVDGADASRHAVTALLPGRDVGDVVAQMALCGAATTADLTPDLVRWRGWG